MPEGTIGEGSDEEGSKRLSEVALFFTNFTIPTVFNRDSILYEVPSLFPKEMSKLPRSLMENILHISLTFFTQKREGFNTIIFTFILVQFALLSPSIDLRSSINKQSTIASKIQSEAHF